MYYYLFYDLGWGRNSFGFHGDDGGIFIGGDDVMDVDDDVGDEPAAKRQKKLNGTDKDTPGDIIATFDDWGREEAILPWQVGETVGAGIDFLTKRVFFTRNGHLIGI